MTPDASLFCSDKVTARGGGVFTVHATIVPLASAHKAMLFTESVVIAPATDILPFAEILVAYPGRPILRVELASPG